LADAANYVQELDLLLVLVHDNREHLLGAVADLAAQHLERRQSPP
jgi:hypothetical protein